jgi:FixJ family two-component response regulator/glycine cleavage system H lipoate-binding protein
MVPLTLILAVIIFVIADILIRSIGKNIHEKKARQERESVLKQSLNLDFSRESKTLKRAEVENPKARILCVDDEEVILDSFRKILVLDGYSVDTVQTGQEALGLIQMHHYDFLFSDLKMPSMSGEDVAKSVKHIRPDIDVIIITGYATVESAVECMKYGVMDYVQKPFTEDELLDFVKKALIKRQDRIEKQLKPRVQISHMAGAEYMKKGEFSIPGGVFISEGHCWASMGQDGNVKVGLDDFAKKLIGRIDGIELPNLGMNVKAGQVLFTIKQGNRAVPFCAPVSGIVSRVNTLLQNNLEELDITPYEKNWICIIDAESLDNDIKILKIGASAVSFYQDEIEKFRNSVKSAAFQAKQEEVPEGGNELYLGEFENLNDKDFDKLATEFFKR